MYKKFTLIYLDGFNFRLMSNQKFFKNSHPLFHQIPIHLLSINSSSSLYKTQITVQFSTQNSSRILHLQSSKTSINHHETLISQQATTPIPFMTFKEHEYFHFSCLYKTLRKILNDLNKLITFCSFITTLNYSKVMHNVITCMLHMSCIRITYHQATYQLKSNKTFIKFIFHEK